MRRAASLCSSLLFGFSLLAFILGVARGFDSAFGRQPEGLRSRESIESIGAVGAESQVHLTITLENPLSRAVTILGGRWVCYPLCCVMYEGPPLRIPALARGTVRLRLVTKSRAGEFQVPFTLYTDCDGQPELTVEVKGEVVADSLVGMSDRR